MGQQPIRWKPSRSQTLGATGIVAALAILLRIGYTVEWTGFGRSVIEVGKNQDLRRAKTLWDWLQLFIVPAALAIGVAWLNWSQRSREREAEEAQKIAEEAKDDSNALEARTGYPETACPRRHVTIVPQSDGDPANREGSHLHSEGQEHAEARVTARAQTLTTLSQVDGDRKRSVLRFLREARLINHEQEPLEGRMFYPRVVGLDDANLAGANLKEMKLRNASLKDTILRNADLTRGNLTGAGLTGAGFTGADLAGADLTGAQGITEEELERQAKSLRGATMPDGRMHD